MAEYCVVDRSQLEADLTAVAEAIRSKAGTGKLLDFPKDYVETVNRIESGTKILLPRDVNFYDCDGTLLYAYTTEELQELAQLPPGPQPPKDFLRFDCWNWTLEQLKENPGPRDVGAIYRTSDGDTYAEISVAEMARATVTLYIGVTNYDADLSQPLFVIDWGDGTVEEKYVDSTGGYDLAVPHTYQSTGAYTLRIHGAGSLYLGHNGSPGFMSGTDYDVCLQALYMGGNAKLNGHSMKNHLNMHTLTLTKNVTAIPYSALKCSLHLRAVILPPDVTTVQANAFEENTNVTVFSMPCGLTSFGYYGLTRSQVRRLVYGPKLLTVEGGYNNALKEAIIPEGVTGIGTEVFCYGYALTELQLPKTLQTIADAAFRYCYGLTKLEIPENVRSIAPQAFMNVNRLRRMTFRPTTPPTVANANAFSGFPASCVIEVPAGTLEAYQSAANYAAVAAQMVEVNDDR